MMPYLSIPVILFGPQADHQDVTPEPDKQVMLRLNPQCIESFYPCYYEGASMIIMMSGKEYMTPASCEAIEQGIAGYWKHVNNTVNAARPDQGRIVSLTPTS